MGHGGIRGTVIGAPSSLALAAVDTLTQAGIRHNLEVPERAFGVAEGWAVIATRQSKSMSFRSVRSTNSGARLRT